MQKKCSKCGEEKDSALFYPKPDTRKHEGDGLLAACKSCIAAQQRERRIRLGAKLLSRQREWGKRSRKKHVLYYKAKGANQRSLKLFRRDGIDRGFHSEDDLRAVLLSNDGKCWICGCLADQFDHVIPMAVGGSNLAHNIKPICRECNHKRSQDWFGEKVAIREAKLLKQIKELLNDAREMAKSKR